jgi:oxygen-independent coproporphyrinogen III oxidase
MRMIGNKQVSLYFHIPFCTQKCSYCHFYVIPDRPASHQILLESFSLELERWRSALEERSLASIYFGGGTPALLEPEELCQILEKVQAISAFSLQETEITIEANPETLTAEKAAKFAQLGVNRLSLGVQSFDDALLAKLGRTHCASKAIDAVHLAAEAGIGNISIDLMYELPGQTVDSWHRSLQKIAQLPIAHLSLYNLTIEPGTLFFKYRDSLLKEIPDGESSLQMYEMAIQVLEACGLQQYEISAFARKGFHSRHNTGYWTGRPFLGIGPSAFSYWNGARFRNIAHLQRYWMALKEGSSPLDFSEQLDPAARQRELLAIALRLLAGVELQNFTAIHGALPDHTQKAVKKLIQEGFLQEESHRIKLTRQGILFYDTVASELI